ncbi:PaaI family thioesterase [Brevundimonas sp. 2R-24]|uniref:PaaI family thioesterase n=1 Tax=Peiella sedimenti TaxID=3061083 RepID=A0ABT8SQI5_9CAUL|nr:PaaI family thioesterase [Caulobacteraceae bacterium XZ-24]
MADVFLPASAEELPALLERLTSAAPHTQALDLRFEGVRARAVRLRLPWREDLCGGQDRILAGGAVTALLDHCAGLSVWADMGGYAPIATLDLRIDYLRAADPGGDLLAEALCYRRTRSIAFVRATAFASTPDEPVAAVQAAFALGAATSPDTAADRS